MTITKKDFKLVRFPENGEFKIIALKNIEPDDHIHWKYGGEFADGNKINNASEEFVALLQLDAIVGQYFYNGRRHIIETDHIAFLRQDKAKVIGEVKTNNMYDDKLRHITVVSTIPHDFIRTNAIHDFIEAKYLSYRKGTELIVFPDHGATKRFEKILTLYPNSIFVFEKERDANTGELTFKKPEKQNPKNNIFDNDIVIFDDIISKGGTFMAIAKMLKDAGGLNITLVVNHADRDANGKPVYDAKKLKESGIDKIILLEDGFEKE